MTELPPTLTAHLFRPLHAELVGVLRTIDGEQWLAPTLARRWRVRDVVAHILDGDLRRLSFHRDLHPVPPAPGPLQSRQDLVAFLNDLNHEWVSASQRLSPTVLLALVEWSGYQVAGFVESLDSFSPGRFPVAWAGADQSVCWMDVGREYTERWHHQQQVREAVGAPILLQEKWMRPLLELSVRAIPPALAQVEASPGTRMELHVEGEGGGSWTVRRGPSGWAIFGGADPGPATTVRISTDTAWRWLYNGRASEGMTGIDVEGNMELARALLLARSVMV